MNTLHKWSLTATVYDPERRAWWESVFGTNTVPIKSPLPVSVTVPILGETLAFLLDLDAIWPEQREKLIKKLAETFGEPEDLVAAELDKGVPIPVTGVYMTCPESLRLAALAGDVDIDGPDEWDDDFLNELEDAW